MADIKEKAEFLYEHFGQSWERAARRSGLSTHVLRSILKEGYSPRKEQREKIDAAYNLYDMHHLVAVIVVKECQMYVSSIEEAETEEERQRAIEDLNAMLDEKMGILQLSNVDRLRDEICG